MLPCRQMRKCGGLLIHPTMRCRKANANVFWSPWFLNPALYTRATAFMYDCTLPLEPFLVPPTLLLPQPWMSSQQLSSQPKPKSQAGALLHPFPRAFHVPRLRQLG